MTTLDSLSHWRLERDADGLAWLTFDRAGSAVNALSADTMAELAAVLDALDAQPPKGLVIRSGKPTGFIVGADVNEFAELNTPEQGRALVARGWNLFNRLAAVRYPTLALIQGNLLEGVELSATGEQPNLILFDVQDGQTDGLAALIEDHDLPVLQHKGRLVTADL